MSKSERTYLEHAMLECWASDLHVSSLLSHPPSLRDNVGSRSKASELHVSSLLSPPPSLPDNVGSKSKASDLHVSSLLSPSTSLPECQPWSIGDIATRGIPNIVLVSTPCRPEHGHTYSPKVEAVLGQSGGYTLNLLPLCIPATSSKREQGRKAVR